MPKTPTVHDYTKLFWGWSYQFLEGGQDWFRACGWGDGLKKGDQILVLLQGTVRIRYWIRKIEYKDNPTDMWFARFERVDEPSNPQEPPPRSK